jgi:hypothetical protein
MNNVELSDSERELLIDLLDREVPNLREEIHYTDDHDYKETLKQREIAVKELLRKLKGE